MTNKRFKICSFMLLLLIMFTINIFYIVKVSSNSGTSYSMPHVAVGDVFTYVYTEGRVGVERTIKIEDIEEDSIEWTIILKAKFGDSTEYSDMLVYDRIPKSSPFSRPGFFCPLPVPEYLIDYINDEIVPTYSVSGNQLIMTDPPYRDVYEYSTETGILSSLTEFRYEEVRWRFELLTESSNNAVSSYNAPLTTMIVVIMMIGIAFAILRGKKHHNM